ncbi:unnamed protein product, partial [Musa acuminata subsp. malaccensis]
QGDSCGHLGDSRSRNALGDSRSSGKGGGGGRPERRVGGAVGAVGVEEGDLQEAHVGGEGGLGGRRHSGVGRGGGDGGAGEGGQGLGAGLVEAARPREGGGSAGELLDYRAEVAAADVVDARLAGALLLDGFVDAETVLVPGALH